MPHLLEGLNDKCETKEQAPGGKGQSTTDINTWGFETKSERKHTYTEKLKMIMMEGRISKE